MRKVVGFLALLLFGVVCEAQDFDSYNSYGFQMTGRFTGMNVTNASNSVRNAASVDMGRGFDAVFHIDRAESKWFGIGAGLGISSLGISDWGGKQLYYGVIPLRLQIKLGMIWLEPGLENRFFLGINEGSRSSYIEPKTINAYHLAGVFNLRFKLFRGLSVTPGLSIGITPAVDLKDTEYATVYGVAYYKTIAAFIGVRYMFNQPY